MIPNTPRSIVARSLPRVGKVARTARHPQVVALAARSGPSRKASQASLSHGVALPATFGSSRGLATAAGVSRYYELVHGLDIHDRNQNLRFHL